MSNTQNLNVLVEAKKEYLNQLSNIMCPVMIETFQDMYAEAHKLSKGKKVLLQYQKVLKEVVNWNNHMVRQHTTRISDSCSWFNDLLAAVFVSFVKILSSVRLNNCETKKISIKLPTNDMFIHGCYIAAAKDIYKDPYIFHEESTEHERDEKLFARFGACIEATVKEMVPVQQILQAYISQTNNKTDLDVMSEAPEDTEDPDILDQEFEELNPEPETVPDLEPAPESDLVPDPEPGNEDEIPDVQEMELPPGASADPEVLDTKNIDIEPKKSPFDAIKPDENVDDDVLFGDAPDEKRNS